MDAVWCYNFDLREKVYQNEISTRGDRNPDIDTDFIDLGPVGKGSTACVRSFLS